MRIVKRNGKTKAAAERALKAALVQRRAPVAGAQVAPDTRISKVAELWFEELVNAVDGGQRSPATLAAYRSIYGCHIDPRLGALRVCEATTPVVDRAISAIKAESPSLARTAKVVISQIMGFAARQGAVTINPVREVGRIDGTPKSPPRALTEEERAQWLAVVDGDERARWWDLPDLTRIMLATGCRIGECLAIGWTEVVFPDSLGGWRDPSNVRRVWRQVRDDAEMRGLVSHTLRKTVASFLDDANVSTRKISDQLGHVKVSMTQDKYLGRRITDRETADVLEGIIPGSGTNCDPIVSRQEGTTKAAGS